MPLLLGKPDRLSLTARETTSHGREPCAPSRSSAPEALELFEDLFFSRREVAGQVDIQVRQDVAATGSIETRQPFAPQPEGAAGGRAGRDPDADRSVQGRYLDFAAEDGGGERHGDLGFEVVPLAFELGVGTGPHPEVEVPAWSIRRAAALAGRADPRALAHAGRYLHFYRAGRRALAHLHHAGRPPRH